MAVMEVMNDLVKSGVLPTPQQRIDEAKVANMESLADVQKAGGMQGQQAEEQAKPPSESISFKDLPPEGKVQMAQQAGIQLSSEQMAKYEQDQKQAQMKAAQQKGQNATKSA